MDDRVFQSRQGHEILLFSKTCRPTVLPSQPHTHWVLQFVGTRWPGPAADQSFSHTAEVKKEWNYSSIPPYAFMVWIGQNLTVICYRIYDSVLTTGRRSHYFAPTFALDQQWAWPSFLLSYGCPNSTTDINLMFSDRASWIDSTLFTNLMHWLLFIHKILLSSTCFEHQVLIFRRT